MANTLPISNQTCTLVLKTFLDAAVLDDPRERLHCYFAKDTILAFRSDVTDLLALANGKCADRCTPQTERAIDHLFELLHAACQGPNAWCTSVISDKIPLPPEDHLISQVVHVTFLAEGDEEYVCEETDMGCLDVNPDRDLDSNGLDIVSFDVPAISDSSDIDMMCTQFDNSVRLARR